MTNHKFHVTLTLLTGAGLLVGTGVSAGATAKSADAFRPDRGGHVRVCQDIREHESAASALDRDDAFIGRYRVKDSNERVLSLRLGGKHTCQTVRVDNGRVRVDIARRPEHTRLIGSDQKTVRVRRGETETVTFRFQERHPDRSPAVG